MSDPYTMAEKECRLTRSALEVIAQYRYPVHITTKSNLILRDIDVLEEINKIYASVSFTLTTCEEELAAKIEPNAPRPSERLKAMGILSQIGIIICVNMMPILPLIEDDKENILQIVKMAKEYGAKHIVPGFGVTLRGQAEGILLSKTGPAFSRNQKAI